MEAHARCLDTSRVTVGMILEGQSRHLKLKQKAGCKPQIADSSGWGVPLHHQTVSFPLVWKSVPGTAKLAAPRSLSSWVANFLNHCPSCSSRALAPACARHTTSGVRLWEGCRWEGGRKPRSWGWARAPGTLLPWNPLLFGGMSPGPGCACPLETQA